MPSWLFSGSNAASCALADVIRAFVKELAPLSEQIIQSFGIPQRFLGPIAASWDIYNEVDNRGEVAGIAWQ